MSIQSLESERQAILNRMHMSRSGFRHMLMDDTAADHDKPASHFADQPQYAAMAPINAHAAEDRFPRSVTMRLIMRHPVAVSLALATLVFVGPRRVVRVTSRSSARVTEVARRNRDNINMLARGVKLALPYVPAVAQYLRTMRGTGRQGRL